MLRDHRRRSEVHPRGRKIEHHPCSRRHLPARTDENGVKFLAQPRITFRQHRFQLPLKQRLPNPESGQPGNAGPTKAQGPHRLPLC